MLPFFLSWWAHLRVDNSALSQWPCWEPLCDSCWEQHCGCACTAFTPQASGHLHSLPSWLWGQLFCHLKQLPHAELTTCASAPGKATGLQCPEQLFLQSNAGLCQGLIQLHCCGHTVPCLSNSFSEFDFSTQSLILTAPSSRDQNHPLITDYSLLWRHWCTEQFRQSKGDTFIISDNQYLLFCLSEKPKVSGLECAHYFSFPTTEVWEICAKKSINKLFLPQHHVPPHLKIFGNKCFPSILSVMTSFHFPEPDKLQFSNERTTSTCMQT